MKQTVQVTAGGKKRITPQPLSAEAPSPPQPEGPAFVARDGPPGNAPAGAAGDGRDGEELREGKRQRLAGEATNQQQQQQGEGGRGLAAALRSTARVHDLRGIPVGAGVRARNAVAPPLRDAGAPVLAIQVAAEDEFGAWGERSGAPPAVLEARAVEGDTRHCELVCSTAGVVKWRDAAAPRAVAIAGNCNFWAVAARDGSLQVYTPAGRRALPSMLLGSPAPFLDCDADWLLLALTLSGDVHVYDLQSKKKVLESSVAPILAAQQTKGGGAQQLGVVSARLAQSGAPLVVLSSRSAFLFHLELRSWLLVAHDGFPSSGFRSVWPERGAGAVTELAQLRYEAASLGPQASTGWGAPLEDRNPELERAQSRAHAEELQAAAEALESPEDYQLWLQNSVHTLTRQGDTGRLREICEGLLGVPHGRQESASDDAKHRAPDWDPEILGLDKRELLRAVVLPAMMANKSLQRLVSEFLDLLNSLEADGIP